MDYESAKGIIDKLISGLSKNRYVIPDMDYFEDGITLLDYNWKNPKCMLDYQKYTETETCVFEETLINLLNLIDDYLTDNR